MLWNLQRMRVSIVFDVTSSGKRPAIFLPDAKIYILHMRQLELRTCIDDKIAYRFAAYRSFMVFCTTLYFEPKHPQAHFVDENFTLLVDSTLNTCLISIPREILKHIEIFLKIHFHSIECYSAFEVFCKLQGSESVWIFRKKWCFRTLFANIWVLCLHCGIESDSE